MENWYQNILFTLMLILFVSAGFVLGRFSAGNTKLIFSEEKERCEQMGGHIRVYYDDTFDNVYRVSCDIEAKTLFILEAI